MKKIKRKIFCAVIFSMGIILTIFMRSWVWRGLRVVLYTNAYYAADCKEIELVYNDDRFWVCNELINSNNGYALPFEKSDVENLKTLEVRFLTTGKSVEVYGMGIEFWGIVLDKIHIKDIRPNNVNEVGASIYAMSNQENAEIVKVYTAWNAVLCKVAVVFLVLILGCIYRGFDSISRALEEQINKSRSESARIQLCHMYSSLFPLLVIVRGMFLERIGVDIRYYCKELAGIIEIIVWLVGAVIWMRMEGLKKGYIDRKD